MDSHGNNQKRNFSERRVEASQRDHDILKFPRKLEDLSSLDPDYLLKELSQNPDLFFQDIQMRPEYRHIVEKAMRPESRSRTGISSFKNQLVSVGNFVKGLLIVNPRELYGKAFVSKKLENDTKNTATIITIANVLNCVPSWSFIYLAVRTFSGGTAISGGVMVLILMFSNSCAVGASTKRQENRMLSRASMFGLIFMNIILTLISGPGTELSMNMRGLSENLATDKVQTLITKKEESIEKLEEKKYDLDREIKDLESQYLMPRGSVEREKAFLEINGPYEYRYNEEYWEQRPYEALPLGRKGTSVVKDIRDIENEIKNIDDSVNESASSLLYLKNNQNEIYQQNFDENGHISESYVASQEAFESFFGRLSSLFSEENILNDKSSNSDWTSLGFTAFVFALSLVTSAVAVYLTLAHSNRDDVRRSFDDEYQKSQEEFFNALNKGIIKSKVVED